MQLEFKARDIVAAMTAMANAQGQEVTKADASRGNDKTSQEQEVDGSERRWTDVGFVIQLKLVRCITIENNLRFDFVPS